MCECVYLSHGNEYRECAHTHTYTRLHTHTLTQTHTHKHTHTHIHTHTHTHTLTYLQTDLQNIPEGGQDDGYRERMVTINRKKFQSYATIIFGGVCCFATLAAFFADVLSH